MRFCVTVFISPSQFHQLYTVNIQIGGFYLPCVYALLSNKRLTTCYPINRRVVHRIQVQHRRVPLLWVLCTKFQINIGHFCVVSIRLSITFRLIVRSLNFFNTQKSTHLLDQFASKTLPLICIWPIGCSKRQYAILHYLSSHVCMIRCHQWNCNCIHRE